MYVIMVAESEYFPDILHKPHTLCLGLLRTAIYMLLTQKIDLNNTVSHVAHSSTLFQVNLMSAQHKYVN